MQFPCMMLHRSIERIGIRQYTVISIQNLKVMSRYVYASRKVSRYNPGGHVDLKIEPVDQSIQNAV